MTLSIQRPVVGIAVVMIFVIGIGAVGLVGSTAVEETEITDWYELDNVSDNLSGDYVLGTELNETTAGYSDVASPEANDGDGFVPLGNDTLPFTGTFDGNGNVIADLHINRSDEDEIGLFGYAEGGEITDLDLVDIDVSGASWAVGGLAGLTDETAVSNVTVSGSVASQEGSWATGGIVGASYDNSTITDVVSHVDVVGDSAAGGIVGELYSSNVTRAEATGNVTGTESAWGTGGVVGASYGSENLERANYIESVTATGTIDAGLGVGGVIGELWKSELHNGTATGDVYASEWAGGLSGGNYGEIFNSSATGDVIATGDVVGGLVGENEDVRVGTRNATIHNSYATGNVTGENQVGGLVGQSNEWDEDEAFRPDIRESFATGDVTGIQDVGGLIGNADEGNTVDTYATGNVTGEANVGGLIGTLGQDSPEDRPREVESSYSAGFVSGDDANTTGGLIGVELDGSVISSYWDKDASNQTDSANGTALATEEMQGEAAVTNMTNFDFDEIWTPTNVYPRLAWETPTDATLEAIDIAGQGDDAIISATAQETANESVSVTVTNTDGVAQTVDISLVITSPEDTTEVDEIKTSEEIPAGETGTVTFENVTGGLEIKTEPYTVSASTQGQEITGSLAVHPDLAGDGNSARDTTGDGLLNDINGDNTVTVADVQLLFQNLNEPIVQDNYEFFRFAGLSSERVSVFDLQALFSSLSDEE